MTKWVFANSEISLQNPHFALTVPVLRCPTMIPEPPSQQEQSSSITVLLDEAGFARVATLLSQADTTRMSTMSQAQQIEHLVKYLVAASESAEKAGVDPIIITSAYAYALVSMWEHFFHKTKPSNAVSHDICNRLGDWLMQNHPMTKGTSPETA